MRLLTVNCCSGDGIEFGRNNEGLFRLAEEDPRFAVSIFSDTESRYVAYRQAVEHADSEYVIIADSSIRIPDDQMRSILDRIEHGESDIYCLRIRGEKYSANESGDGRSFVNVDNPLFFPRYIFRRTMLTELEINPGGETYYEDAVLLRAVGKGIPELIDQELICTDDRRLETNLAKYERAIEESWYTEYIGDLMIPFLREGSKAEQQMLSLYMINLKYMLNRTIYGKNILDAADEEAFNQIVDVALGYIDKGIFLNETMWRRIGFIYCLHFYGRKRGGSIEISAEGSGPKQKIYIDGIQCTRKNFKLTVYAVNIIDDALLIDVAFLEDLIRLSRRSRLTAVCCGEEYAFVRTHIYSEVRSLGISIADRPTFQVRIPLSNIQSGRIRFFADIEGYQINLGIEFRSVASRLTEKSNESYCRIEGYLIAYEQDAIIVRRGYRGWLAKDIRYLRDIPKIRKSRRDALNAMLLHIVYRLYSIFASHRPKWVFYDKLYKGGDNGEHLFTYAYSNVNYADAYYVINKDSDDYRRLKAVYGCHILAYNSLRQKLVVLKADILFATHVNAFKFCGFGPTLQACFRGELKAKVVCIQHGLTIQDMPQHQSRLVDNTRVYFCASEREIENLMQPAYGYTEEDLILTGLPRYDALENRDSKQILITPTWRRDIVIAGNKTGDSKEYNPRFKESEYFRVFNDLINNEKLIQCAERTGYSIVFLLHPTLGVQMKDFTAPAGVKLVNGAKALYDDILAKSSLMVTDYSGVQFDFAYMKKPVVYYHPEELPPQYESGHFSYEDDGFGPIITGQGDLIDEICSYMEKGCSMESEYISRVDKFFRYTDNRNCERICKEIKRLFY